MEDKIILNSLGVELSENEEDRDYLNIKFVLCDFKPNGNNVMLNRATIDSWLQTLVNKPVVGKISGNDFTSHQYKNGKFNTDAFGVFTKVYISTLDTGDECIIAEGMIWKRFEKACGIIQSRISRGLTVSSSWELINNGSHIEEIDGRRVKVIDSGLFTGHCLLGAKTPPAYDCSRVVDVAEKEPNQEEIEFSQALLDDINNIGGEEMTKVELSQYGINQLRDDMRKAIMSLLNIKQGEDKYIYLVDIFIDTNQVVYELEEYTNGSYTNAYYIADFKLIEGGVEVSNPQPAEKQYVTKEQHDNEVSALANSVASKEAEISSLKEELTKIKAELSEKDGQIIKLGETINSQKETIAERDNLISELEPVKAEMERLKAEKEAKELAEKQEAMKSYVISTKYFTSEEIEANEEMKNAIAELNEAKVNSLIAKKVIAEAENSKKKCAEEKCPKCGKNPCECSKKKCAEENEEAKKKCAEDEEDSKKKCSELETSETHIDINLSNNGEGNIKTTSIASLLAKRNKRF